MNDSIVIHIFHRRIPSISRTTRTISTSTIHLKCTRLWSYDLIILHLLLFILFLIFFPSPLVKSHTQLLSVMAWAFSNFVMFQHNSTSTLTTRDTNILEDQGNKRYIVATWIHLIKMPTGLSRDHIQIQIISTANWERLSNMVMWSDWNIWKREPIYIHSKISTLLWPNNRKSVASSRWVKEGVMISTIGRWKLKEMEVINLLDLCTCLFILFNFLFFIHFFTLFTEWTLNKRVKLIHVKTNHALHSHQNVSDLEEWKVLSLT